MSNRPHNSRLPAPTTNDPAITGERGTASLPIHTRTIIEMRDGAPVPVQVEILGRRNLEYEKSVQLAKTYEPQRNPETGELFPGEEDLIGLTKFEVGVLRMADRFAAGDPDTYKYFEDRILGKAKQQVEATTTNYNLFEFLDRIEKQENSNRQEIVTTDAVILHENPPAAPPIHLKHSPPTGSTPTPSASLIKLIQEL